MATIEALMQANLLEIFGERDANRRIAAIARTYHPDGIFKDHDSVVSGLDAVNAKAQDVQAKFPTFTFTPNGPVRVMDDLGYYAWEFGPEGEPPAIRGVDIGIARDGLIATMYTVLLVD